MHAFKTAVLFPALFITLKAADRSCFLQDVSISKGSRSIASLKLRRQNVILNVLLFGWLVGWFGQKRKRCFSLEGISTLAIFSAASVVTWVRLTAIRGILGRLEECWRSAGIITYQRAHTIRAQYKHPNLLWKGADNNLG